MKKVVYCLLILFGSLSACRSYPVADQNLAHEKNASLTHWMLADSNSIGKGDPNSKTSDIHNHNTKQLREHLEKEKDSPYWGESIYYMLKSFFGK